jgi:hypothetical protein
MTQLRVRVLLGNSGRFPDLILFTVLTTARLQRQMSVDGSGLLQSFPKGCKKVVTDSRPYASARQDPYKRHMPDRYNGQEYDGGCSWQVPIRTFPEEIALTHCKLQNQSWIDNYR